jgi:predicted nucleic acid-binding protein
MKVVVADTGPVHYLVLIGACEVLPALFGKIVISSTVDGELRHPSAPAAVRNFVEFPPEWLEVDRSLFDVDASWASPELDAGERATLTLAARLSADLVLMDDRKGVRVARRKGFDVTGTVGILDFAAQNKLIDIGAAVSRLEATNFRCHRHILDALLAQHGKAIR